MIFFQTPGPGPGRAWQNFIYRGRGRACQKVPGFDRGRGRGRAPGRVLRLVVILAHCGVKPSPHSQYETSLSSPANMRGPDIRCLVLTAASYSCYGYTSHEFQTFVSILKPVYASIRCSIPLYWWTATPYMEPLASDAELIAVQIGYLTHNADEKRSSSSCNKWGSVKQNAGVTQITSFVLSSLANEELRWPRSNRPGNAASCVTRALREENAPSKEAFRVVLTCLRFGEGG